MFFFRLPLVLELRNLTPLHSVALRVSIFLPAFLPFTLPLTTWGTSGKSKVPFSRAMVFDAEAAARFLFDDEFGDEEDEEKEEDLFSLDFLRGLCICSRVSSFSAAVRLSPFFFCSSCHCHARSVQVASLSWASFISVLC